MCVNPSSPLGLTVERSTCSFRDAFNNAWQLAQTSGVKGSMNLAQQALLQTGSDTPRICRQILDYSQKGARGFGQSTLPVPWLTLPVLLYCALFLCGNEIS